MDRDDWKLIGKILLATQGPAYAERLRERALQTNDPAKREELLAWARAVERGAQAPKETVDDIETLYDLIFGKPNQKRKGTKRHR